MIYKELQVVSAIIPAGTIIGAPLGPVKFCSVAANTEEQAQELNQLRFKFQGVTDAVERQPTLDGQTVINCTVQERDYEVLNLSVTENTFVKLRGQFAVSPLVFLECGIVAGDSNNGSWVIAPEVNGTDPVVIDANNNATWKQRARTGSSLSAGDASLIHGQSAYVLLQDVPFTGVIEFHNTVSDRVSPFNWPLFNFPQDNYNLPGRQTDGHWLWTDMHDGEEMLKYVRAWKTAPIGKDFPLRLPEPSNDASEVDLPGDPDWDSSFGVYMPVPCGVFKRCVVMLDQHIGVSRPLVAISDVEKQGTASMSITSLGVAAMSAQPLRLPAKPTYDAARRWLNGEEPHWSGRYTVSGIVVWFYLDGYPHCRVALPLSPYYEYLATEITELWGLGEATSINGGAILLGPVPETLVARDLWQFTMLEALPVDVRAAATIAVPRIWSRLAFYTVTDDDFYSGMGYLLYDLLFRGSVEDGKLLSTLPCVMRVSQMLLAPVVNEPAQA